MSGNAELLDQPELRKQFRFTENRFGKNFLVEEIETPRPKPDEVDQENRKDNCRNRDDSEKPFQDGFKHRQRSAGKLCVGQ
jgi:hypothetical protein